MSAPVAILAAMAVMQSGVPQGTADFEDMSDRQLASWIGNAHFFHAANVFRCQGLRYSAAVRELNEALGRDYDRRHEAIGSALARRYGPPGEEIILPIGYRTTRRYCRNIRFVIRDILRGTSELERRLGLSS